MSDHAPPPPIETSMICLLGAPGTGKGTQGSLLAQHLAGVHISVGDLVRQQQLAGIRVPRDRRSRLVDTAFTVELVRAAAAAAAARGTIVLDGFPRLASQVEAFVDLPWGCRGVLWLNVDFAIAIERMKGRGREGENVAQIGMRHLNHEAAARELRQALVSAHIPVHEIDANGSVERVQEVCRAMLPTMPVDRSVDS